jgi:hypothetical protein
MKLTTLLAGTTTAALILTVGVTNAAAHPEPRGGTGGGGVGATCVVYGGWGARPGDVDNCDNNGHASALELFGCDFYKGVPHYAWGGVTGYGRVRVSFGAPIAATKEFLIPSKPHYQFHYFDAHLQEHAYRVWELDYTMPNYPGGSWILITWLECCTCKTKGEAYAAYLQHVLPKIRAAMSG